MKKIETEIVIDAAPEKIWKILTDFENHPRWNPFITSITGEKVAGKTITVSIKPPEGTEMTFKPIILRYEPYREFRWKGKLGIPGLFDGEHYFILEELESTRTRFIHGEQFSGLLIGMMGKTLDKTRHGFVLMNESLKRESEKEAVTII